MERNARAQAQLIEDLLDVSSILAGKLRLKVEPVDLRTVVEAALDTVRPAADAKDIRLQPALDSIGIVMGDSYRLQQVAWNLLSNAVKFTPKGGRVQVVVTRTESLVELTVADSGQGISAEFQPHVFERFRQADGGTTRFHGGLGLGLSIVRQLVEMHGGRVSVFSEGEGHGARCTVRLPLSATRLRESGPPLPTGHSLLAKESGAPPELHGLRVLVVDDEEDARDMLRTLLESCGAQVRVASSVEEGLHELTCEPPDVLLSDIGMPGQDGYTFMERVRKLPRERGGNVSAVALTAYARVEDRTQALLAGFDHHVTKPVDPMELLAVVASLSVRAAR